MTLTGFNMAGVVFFQENLIYKQFSIVRFQQRRSHSSIFPVNTSSTGPILKCVLFTFSFLSQTGSLALSCLESLSDFVPVGCVHIRIGLRFTELSKQLCMYLRIWSERCCGRARPSPKWFGIKASK